MRVVKFNLFMVKICVIFSVIRCMLNISGFYCCFFVLFCNCCFLFMLCCINFVFMFCVFFWVNVLFGFCVLWMNFVCFVWYILVNVKFVIIKFDVIYIVFWLWFIFFYLVMLDCIICYNFCWVIRFDICVVYSVDEFLYILFFY